jgi:peroxiredoxin
MLLARGCTQQNGIKAQVNMSKPSPEIWPLRPFELSGKPAPDFRLELLSGQVVSLRQLGRERVVVLLFWALWGNKDDVQKDALQQMGRVAEGFDDDELLILGVCIPPLGTRARTQDIVDASGADFRVAMGSSAMARAYGISGVPTTVVVDAEGRVVGWHPVYSPRFRERILPLLERLTQTGATAKSPADNPAFPGQ